ncbi:hypothetical protein TWF694_006005 [Orbilia ellipsospora]|uniref:Uncharacterized protein n=1 Tax=Orbilia ellipsospora TaxID=2528407 RepID=A0AAV9WT20_9PEZI
MPRPLRALSALLYLIAHPILCIALAFAVAFGIDGYEAIDGSVSRYADGKLRFHVNDITTFVSAGLVVVKLLVSSWSAIALWECVYILRKEFNDTATTTNDAKASDGPYSEKVGDNKAIDTDGRLQFMISRRLPPWFKYPFKVPRGGQSWVILVVLLFILPQAFLAPLLSGSIDWAASFTLKDETRNLNSVSPIADFGKWYWYNSPGDGIHDLLSKRAAGYAALAWANSIATAKNGTSITGNGCRHVTNDADLPVNSTLLNAIVPCIRINSISWAMSEEETTLDDRLLVEQPDKLSLVGNSLSDYYISGAAAAFDANNLNIYNINAPNPTIFSGTLSVGLLLDRQRTTTPLCMGQNATAFGPGDRYNQYYNLPRGNSWDCACYLVGKISFTAGVTTSRLSTYVSPRIVEDQTPIDEVVFEPSPWVQPAIWALPDLMLLIPSLNASQFPTWDNLDLYTEGLVRQAYLAAWDALHDYFEEENNSYVAIPSEQTIRAKVSFTRVFAWLAVSLLMPLAGILMLALRGIVILPEEIEKVLTRVLYSLLT